MFLKVFVISAKRIMHWTAGDGTVTVHSLIKKSRGRRNDTRSHGESERLDEESLSEASP